MSRQVRTQSRGFLQTQTQCFLFTLSPTYPARIFFVFPSITEAFCVWGLQRNTGSSYRAGWLNECVHFDVGLSVECIYECWGAVYK